MQDKLHTFLQHIVPQHGLTRLVGTIMESKQPWLKDLLITWFIKQFNVDMSIAEKSDPKSYPDFNSFFTRHLKPDARPIAENLRAIVSPVDGCISQFGKIDSGKIIQAKGHEFTVESLLTPSSGYTHEFMDGEFMTLYLAPRDYHRIHMPLAGQLKKMIYVPGKLFSVSLATSQNVPELFSRNERLVCFFDTECGPMAMVYVGAMLVASMATSWSGVVTPPRSKVTKIWDYSQQNIELDRGQEAGYFKLGSTVILLFGPNRIRWQSGLASGASVNMGQEIALIS